MFIQGKKNWASSMRKDQENTKQSDFAGTNPLKQAYIILEVSPQSQNSSICAIVQIMLLEGHGTTIRMQCSSLQCFLNHLWCSLFLSSNHILLRNVFQSESSVISLLGSDRQM